jgi:Uncharacterized ABC-type transport system, periplasmic component/surface lipoprotein
MEMKKLFGLILLSVLCISVVFAGGAQESGAKADSAKDSPMKIAIVLSTGGLGDKNFNDMAYDGLKKAEADFGIEFNYYEPQTSSDFEGALRNFANSGEYALIIGIGADQVDALKEVTPDYPEQKFSLIDAQLDLPNVKSNATKWQEQTFLCGMYAGLGTLSDMPLANDKNVVGVILGMDTPVLRAGVVGFTAGAKYVNPDVEVLEAVVGSFNDPAKGKVIGISMNNRGADFIQPIAGASGLGLFNAAHEVGFYAFGVGGNQNYIQPDVVAATSIRNVNEMVYNEVAAVVNGTWKAGVNIAGLKEDAVGYSNEFSDVQIPAYIAEAIESAKAKIKSGELVICSTADELDAWVKNNQYSK